MSEIAVPPTDPVGLTGPHDLLRRPLIEALFRRRTHRVSSGSSVPAKSMSYVSGARRRPLTELEEAFLIAVTGCTGLVMPDRPFEDPKTSEAVMAKPYLTMLGRTAGSPDNAQGTHFFMLNDTGTYYLRKLPPRANGASPFDPSDIVQRAREAKVKLFDHRIDVGPNQRDFPAYLDSNRLLSNLPGTTLFFPVVDLSRQYINGLMYLLTQPDGARPAIVDDRNFYALAGVKKWVDQRFLNSNIRVPLGVLYTLRTQIEAELLLQNLMLVADSMGLGAWIHGSITPPLLMGDPKFTETYGSMLGFEHATPKWGLGDIIRWQIPLPKYSNLRSHPIGLKHNDDYLIRAMCPPYYPTMSDAVDEIVQEKFGPNGVFQNLALFRDIYKGDYGPRYLSEAADYSPDIINCARDVCNYIFRTHGRFPAHCDALYAPGIWLQAHHVDEGYYARFFRFGLDELHRSHDQAWHHELLTS